MALEDLISKTRAALKQRAQHRDVSVYVRQDQPSKRSLADALAGEHLGYIFECERTLPFGEQTTSDFDPTALARTFAPFADALSLTTNQSHLDESREHLGAIRNAVDVPVVLNDMIVDPYQIYEARYFGADAITLMPSVLGEEDFAHCVSVARSLQVDPIATVRTAGDIEQALAEDVQIIGVDHRDFDRGEFDLSTTLRLSAHIPDDRTTVAIGGVDDHHQTVGLRDHVDAVLTGGSLVESGDVPRALRQLIFGRVKVCGLAHAEHAQAAWQAGATLGGLIFAPGSARHVSYDHARSICAAAPLDFVGVFVDDSMDDVACCAEKLALSAVQLHGTESNDYMLELRRRLPQNTDIWKAVHVQGELPNLSAIHADRVLLDNFERGVDGTSNIFDWTVLGRMDERARHRIVLGGGLTPDNAARADQFGTWALDVNLGVESSAGVKSSALMDRFFGALRGKRG